MISFLFAFMWLFSASGINAFAQNDNNIYYSDPVTAPVRTAETPLPEKNAEETPGIPAAEGFAEEPESLPDGEAGKTETGMSEEEAVQDENGELPEEYTGDDGNAVQEEMIDTEDPVGNQGEPAETEETAEDQGEPAETEDPAEDQEEPAETEETAENQGEPAETEETAEDQGEPAEAEDPAEDQGEPAEAEDPAEDQEEPAETEDPAEDQGEPADTEDGTGDGETDDQPEKTWYAGSLTAETEGCTVRIDYPAEACIDENASLTLNTVKGMELYTALKSAAKLVRNEQDETWKQQVSDDGNLFYMLTLTDPEGNEIRPETGINLICEQSDSPDGVTYFLTGDDARILEEQKGMLTVSDYHMEPFGYATVERIQTGIVTQEFQAADYLVTAAYGPEAGFPSDTEMKVREIQPETPEYALYSDMTEETLGEEWSEITLERYFDITFVSGGKEVEPQAEVDVQIIFKDVIELTEEHDVQAVHIENNEAKIIESETDSNEDTAKRSGEVIDTVSFTSDSFSVYGVVQRTKITQKVLAADGNTYEINVTYGQDAAIPADAELIVTELLPGEERYDEYLRKAVLAAYDENGDEAAKQIDEDSLYISGNQYARFFDIEIRSEEQKIEPEGIVSVSITLADAPEDRLDELMVVHFTGEDADVLSSEIDEETRIQFTADSFSVYGVLTYPAEQPAAENLEGRNVTINHNGQYLRANILYNGNSNTNRFEGTGSGDATVWTFEATDQSGVYNIYTTDDQGNKVYMRLSRRDSNRAHAELGSEPQAFTVTQGSNGRYVFTTISNNTTYYLNDFNGENGFAGWYQHDAGYDEMSLEFRDPVMQDGKEYMVLVKHEGKYYIVNNDASLTKVDYDPDTKKVRVDNPMLWTVKGNGSNRHISYKSEAVGYDWTQQPSDYYLCYLNAGEEEALTEENAGNVGLDNTNDPHQVTNRQYIEYITALNYSGNHLYNSSNYLGVALEDGVPVRLTGGQTGDSAAEFVFADATDVLPPDHYNHTVDHIDISISSASRVSVPLAYGTYYYLDPDSGEYKAYVVSTNTTLSLNTPVVIDSDDMKNASIKAYDKDHNEVDDAFVINGFSSNAEVEEGSAQVRINGSFKVADLEPFTYWDEINETTRATRMNNAITYVVSVVKNLTFDMQDETHGQLYELVDGEYVPLTITTDVDMTASFSYFDLDNKCPPLQSTGPYGNQDNYDYWRSGGIPTGSGMDFTLGGDAGNDSPNVVAIEVMKLIVDEDGEIIHPAKKITYKMGIHAKAGANGDPAVANSVAQTNVGSYNGDTVSYDGYKLLHSKNITVGTDGTGLIYDYAIVPGMVYVSEDKEALRAPFEDTVGNVWEYKETVITTEYIHRGNEYDSVEELHYSKTYTLDDSVYAAIPEVLGYFTKENGQTKKSGFIEFFVNNVYINTSVTSLEAEKQWAEGTTIPEDAVVTMDLYYAKRQISENGTPLENVADWPDYEEYLPAGGDPIFTGRGETSIVLTATESWQGAFTELPKTWKDSDDNDWELDYYAKESAVMLNEENVIDRYSQETVKEEAAADEADRVDGKVTVTNTANKTSLTVKKEWDPEGEDSHYEEDSITLRLIRYKKDAPLPPAKGIINITHDVEGLDSLPDGFTVIYTYSGPESGTVTSTGNIEIEVEPGDYTVTAEVLHSAAPEGSTYTGTSGAVMVTVPEDGPITAAFISYYDRAMGTLVISHTASGLESSQLPHEFEATYSYTGENGSDSDLSAGEHTVPAGTYNVYVNVTNIATPSGYIYQGTTTGPLTVTVPAGKTGTAVFVSSYAVKSVATVHIYKTNYGNYYTFFNNNTDFYEGDTIAITWTRQGHCPGGYTINGTQHDFENKGTSYISETITYDIPSTGDYKGQVTIEFDDPWGNVGNVTVSKIAGSVRINMKGVRYRASAGMTSSGMRAVSNIPEGYGIDEEGYITFTLNRGENWTKVLDNLPVLDKRGEPYYYGIEEVSVPGYTSSYNPAAPVIATQVEDTEMTVHNKLNTAFATENRTLTVFKTDGTDPLAGAVFTLMNGENTVRQYVMGEDTEFVIRTDDAALADILPPVGESISLTLEETTPPEGYKMVSTPYTVVISTRQESNWNADHTAWTTTTVHDIRIDGQNSLIVPNTPIRTISVNKLVTDHGTASDGLNEKTIRFGLFSGDDEPADDAVPAEGCTGELTISGSSANGMLFENLAPGKYWVYELDENNHPMKDGKAFAVDGDTYTVQEAEPSVTLTDPGDEETVTITNNKEGTGSLTVKKTLAGEDANMSDRFHFTVTQTSEPKLNGTYGNMTFDNGAAAFELGHDESLTAEGLPYGFTYTVTETEANTNDYITVVIHKSNLTVETEDEEGEPVILDEADWFIKTDEVETVTVVNTRMLQKSIRVSKEWMGIPYDETENYPEVTFTLWQATGQDWWNARKYEDVDDENDETDYNSIKLNYENHWIWECKTELPEEDDNGNEFLYFAVEKGVNGEPQFGIAELIDTNPLIEEFPITIDGYQRREVKDVGDWEGKKPYNQPYEAAVHNHGEIKMLNKTPGYMTLELKKKFLEYRSDGNGATSLYTTTGETENMRNMIIELQIMRRIVDPSSGTDVLLTGWETYGVPFQIGYNADGGIVVENTNPFPVRNRGGEWHFIVDNGEERHGLPTKGLYKKDGSIIVVRYQYLYKETQVYDGNMNPIGGQWISWLPKGHDANGAEITIQSLQTGQDQDRMLNAPATTLSIEKEWIGSHRNIEEIYIKVSRRTYGSTGAYEDYLAVIGNEMDLGQLSQNHFGSNSASVFDNTYDRIVLNDTNGWKANIDKVQVFPNGNNQNQYEYRIDEIGYKDKSGNTYNIATVDEVFEPEYFRWDRNGNDWETQEGGVLLTVNGPNKLKVTNTSPYGSLEIIKEVPEASAEAAENKTFTFTVTLTIPSGTTFSEEDLSAEEGTISGFTMSGDTAVFTVTRRGSGTAVVDGIPYGTTYEVTEGSVPDGWKQEGSTEYSDSARIVSREDQEPDTATVTNKEITTVTVEKIWKVNGQTAGWPEGAEITAGLYRSVNNGEPEAVTGEDQAQRTVSFGVNATAEERSFTELPVYDVQGQRIDYSIRELSITSAQETAAVTDDTVTFAGKTWQVSASDPDRNGKATITNSRTEIHILKIDTQTNEVLTGAEFRLEKHNGSTWEVLRTPISVGTEGDDTGRATIEILTDGEYRISEIKAPPGYIPLGKPAVFTVQNGTVSFENTGYITYDEDTATFTVPNKAGLALPNTGGPGTQIYMAGGLAMALFAGLLLIRRRKKQQ